MKIKENIFSDDVYEFFAQRAQGTTKAQRHGGAEKEDTYGFLHTVVNGETIKKKYPSLKGSYADYYLELYNTIVNGAPLREKPAHGYNTIRIIELAFESHQQKKTLACTGLK